MLDENLKPKIMKVFKRVEQSIVANISIAEQHGNWPLAQKLKGELVEHRSLPAMFPKYLGDEDG